MSHSPPISPLSRYFYTHKKVPDVSAVEFFVDGRWVPIESVIPDTTWLGLSNSLPGGGSIGGGAEGRSLVEAVRKRGAAVLGARKLSSAMSAANAIAEHLSDWLSTAKSGE